MLLRAVDSSRAVEKAGAATDRKRHLPVRVGPRTTPEDRDGTDASAIEVATNASSNGQAAPQARPVQRDAHPHCVRSFFVLHNALPHCNMVGRICAEHPIERP
jgi:hypothetical protein